MKLSHRLIALAAILALLSWVAPERSRRMHEPTPASNRVARMALDPFLGILTPAYWLAMTRAMAHHQPYRALEFGRKLLFLLPHSPEHRRNLILYLAFGATGPLMESNPPRVTEAYDLLENALSLARDALDHHFEESTFDAMLSILRWLEGDERADHGLRRLYVEEHGERPRDTMRHLIEKHPMLEPRIREREGVEPR